MAAIFTPGRTRLTVEQFHKMGEAGIFAPEARLELIDGEILEMAPIGPRHMKSVTRLTQILASSVGNAAMVSVQNPVVLDDYSEPQPDVVILTKEWEDAETRLPEPRDTLLLIEVADTTLRFDRNVKLKLYAQRGVQEVWIVNLVDRVLEIYREPKDGAYQSAIERRAGDTVSPLGLPDVKVPLASILQI